MLSRNTLEKMNKQAVMRSGRCCAPEQITQSYSAGYHSLCGCVCVPKGKLIREALGEEYYEVLYLLNQQRKKQKLDQILSHKLFLKLLSNWSLLKSWSIDETN